MESGLCKDIRILHMKEWLLKTMKQNYEIFMHFERALGNHHFMADCVNIFSALIRNGVAYAYLIGQVLAGNMDAPQFILYFSAVSVLQAGCRESWKMWHRSGSQVLGFLT